MKSSNWTSRKHSDNIVKLAVAPAAKGVLPYAGKKSGAPGAKGMPDVRVNEAMRLAQAFLAIEDPVARRALIDLADRLVSYDWARKMT